MGRTSGAFLREIICLLLPTHVDTAVVADADACVVHDRVPIACRLLKQKMGRKIRIAPKVDESRPFRSRFALTP